MSLKTFPCGCSLTRNSWQLCREHYDSKEGRLDAYLNELERLEASEARVIDACKTAVAMDEAAVAEMREQWGYVPSREAQSVTDKLRAALTAAGEQT